jgi:glycosyltransferase involved in cell wall biosynthesis
LDYSEQIGTQSTWPTIEAIIPSYNCRQKLRVCLTKLRSQEYPGGMTFRVIDGGSIDGTDQVAEDLGARVVKAPGMYSDGLRGAKNTAAKDSRAELLWFVDSDNYLSGPAVAAKLVGALQKHPTANIAVPLPEISVESNSYARWLSLVEEENLRAAFSSPAGSSNILFVSDLNYGLPNAALLRRRALLDVGGFDVDVRVLARMRRAGLASAVLVTDARFVHDSVSSPMDFATKMVRRIHRFGRMSSQELEGYLVEYPPDHEALGGSLRASVISAPARAIKGFLQSGRPEWFWGLAYPGIVLAVVAAAPGDAVRVYRRFL